MRGMGKMMAIVTVPVALGPILGPVIGGLILGSLSWRWLFLVNVPVVLIGIALAMWKLPDDSARRIRAKLDVIGLLLLAPGLALMLLGLSNIESGKGAASVDVLLPVIVGIALVGGFTAWSLRRREKALVQLRLLGRRTLATSSIVMTLSGGALFGAMLLLPLYFQIVRGTDVLTAALLLIPQGVGALLSRTLAGRLTDSLGARTVAIAGFVVMGLATVPFALSDGATNEIWLMITLLVRGFGMGAVMIPVMSVAFVGLERDEVPHASIITRLAQQIGGAFGTAVLAVILEATTSGATGIADIANGFDTAFWWAVGFTVVAIGVCFALPAPVKKPAVAASTAGTPARSR